MSFTNEKEMIYQVHLKLGLSSLEEAEISIQLILQALRDKLPVELSEEIVEHLPEKLMLMYLAGWEKQSSGTILGRLDEFVSSLVNPHHVPPLSGFRSEIDSLKTTLIVLHELEKRYTVLEYLPFVFRQDLKNAWLEEAA